MKRILFTLFSLILASLISSVAFTLLFKPTSNLILNVLFFILESLFLLFLFRFFVKKFGLEQGYFPNNIKIRYFALLTSIVLSVFVATFYYVNNAKCLICPLNSVSFLKSFIILIYFLVIFWGMLENFWVRRLNKSFSNEVLNSTPNVNNGFKKPVYLILLGLDLIFFVFAFYTITLMVFAYGDLILNASFFAPLVILFGMVFVPIGGWFLIIVMKSLVKIYNLYKSRGSNTF